MNINKHARFEDLIKALDKKLDCLKSVPHVEFVYVDDWDMETMDQWLESFAEYINVPNDFLKISAKFYKMTVALLLFLLCPIKMMWITEPLNLSCGKIAKFGNNS